VKSVCIAVVVLSTCAASSCMADPFVGFWRCAAPAREIAAQAARSGYTMDYDVGSIVHVVFDAASGQYFGYVLVLSAMQAYEGIWQPGQLRWVEQTYTPVMYPYTTTSIPGAWAYRGYVRTCRQVEVAPDNKRTQILDTPCSWHIQVLSLCANPDVKQNFTATAGNLQADTILVLTGGGVFLSEHWEKLPYDMWYDVLREKMRRERE
jgi:hypothetical protein